MEGRTALDTLAVTLGAEFVLLRRLGADNGRLEAELMRAELGWTDAQRQSATGAFPASAHGEFDVPDQSR
jgi:hypothetical protein